MRHITAFLVKWRYLFIILMAVCTVISVFLIPKTHIVTDLTTLLPDDSRMREGLDEMRGSFPDFGMDMATVNVMYPKDGIGKMTDTDSTRIVNTEGIVSLTSRRENDSWSLYQFSVERGADCSALVKEIESFVPRGTIVEPSTANLLPDNIMYILLLGCSLVLVILFIMCSSWVEALLFLIAIGMAVAINMGTNALLPGVSMVTNTIAAVLQLVLSMDYSIILMNRYRQERSTTDNPEAAMSCALLRATPSILSSALTTIVGLSMLAFMKFKIGMDMGVVFSKGVLCSLLSIYTILPALIIRSDKAIFRYEKKVPILSTDGLARFEIRFRIPLAVLFVLLFAGSYVMHNGTRLSFSNVWPTVVTEQFPPKNPVMMLYPSDKGDQAIRVIDSLASDNKVQMALSYHSILDRRYTVSEFPDAIARLANLSDDAPTDLGMLDEDILRLLFYARSHPERDERMSIEEIIELAERMSKDPRVPGQMDVNSVSAQLLPAPSFSATSETPVQVEESVAAMELPETAQDTAYAPVIPIVDTVNVAEIPVDVNANEYGDATRQLTFSQMAQAYGFDAKEAMRVYRMAGRSGGTMSPKEFFDFLVEDIMGRKIYASMISAKQKTELVRTRERLDSIIMAGPPTPVTATQTEDMPAIPDDRVTASLSRPDSCVQYESVEIAMPDAEVDIPDPMDELLDLTASGRKVSTAQLRHALRRAGIDIPGEYIDLMYLYHGAMNTPLDEDTMSLSELLSFVRESIVDNPVFAQFIGDDAKAMVSNAEKMLTDGLGRMVSDKWSVAAFITDYPVESAETFDYISRLQSTSDDAFDGNCYLIGESVMYKEMKDGSRKELLILTILTALAIFIIVALSFKSLIIPVILIITVLSAVFVNVTVSGIGGRPMLYLAYLIVQSILMGATIDYGILFTNYYREMRHSLGIREALMESYRRSIHTIMTSGLIIICVPLVMSRLIEDPTISAILGSLTVGSLAALIIILLILPGVLCTLDHIICKPDNINRKRVLCLVFLAVLAFVACRRQPAPTDYPHAEWDPARVILMHTPGQELFNGSLHPTAALFEEYFDVDKAAEEHRGYIHMLERNGIRVYTVGDILNEVGIDSLRILANNVLTYDISEVPDEDTDASEAYRQEVLSQMSRADLIRCILNPAPGNTP